MSDSACNSLPKITVIVPVHNKRPHLRRAIDSILAQTFRDFELIVVDDASTDESLDEIADVLDPRLRVVTRSTPGPGGYAARNLGLELASSRWAAFLDADDEWFPDHLQELVMTLERFPDYGLYTCGWKSVTGPRVVLNAYDAELRARGAHVVTWRYYAAVVAAARRYCVTSVVAVDVQKTLAVGGFPAGLTKKGGDLLVWLRLIRGHQGVWHDRLGGILHRDSVNMVTNTQFFSAELIAAFEQLAAEETDRRIQRDLYKYINRLVRDDHVRGILAGRSDLTIFRNFYRIQDWSSGCQYAFWRSIPAPIVRFAHRILRLWRRTLSTNAVHALQGNDGTTSPLDNSHDRPLAAQPSNVQKVARESRK